MLTSIENIPQKSHDMLKVQSANEFDFADKMQQKTRLVFPVLPVLMVVLCIALVLSLSFALGQLFFKELLISSFIVIMLGFFRLIDRGRIEIIQKVE